MRVPEPTPAGFASATQPGAPPKVASTDAVVVGAPPPIAQRPAAHYWEEDVGPGPASPPDRPGYDIIVVGGQSNGVGWARVDDHDDPHPSIFALNASNDGEVPARDPLPQSPAVLAGWDGATPAFASQGKGFALSLARRYAACGLLRPRRRILLVQTAIASAGFSTKFWGPAAPAGDWNSSGPTAGAPVYLNFVARVSAAMGRTFNGSAPADNRIVALCWQHGEADGQMNMAARTYKAHLAAFMAHWVAAVTAHEVAALGLAPSQAAATFATMTMLVGGMTPAVVAATTSGYGTAGTEIVHAQRDSAGVVHGHPVFRGPTAYVTAQGIGLDETDAFDAHFDEHGFEMLAASYTDRWLRRLGRMPPPVLRGAFTTWPAAPAPCFDISARPVALRLAVNDSSGGVWPLRDPTRRFKAVLGFNLNASTAAPRTSFATADVDVPRGCATLSAWVRWGAPAGDNASDTTDAGAGAADVIAMSAASVDGVQWTIAANAAAHAIATTVALAGGGARATVATPSSWVAVDAWTHVVATFAADTGALALFVNGTAAGSTIGGGPASVPAAHFHGFDRVYLGSAAQPASAGARAFSGALDDPRVYAECLTPAQVALLFASTQIVG